MKTVVVVNFTCGYIEVYSTISTFLKNNKGIKLKAQTIRNKMSGNDKAVYHHEQFTLKRYFVRR